MPGPRVITEKEIEDGLCVVARLIERYGDAYWPVFDRLERELEEKKKRAHRLRLRLSQRKI